MIPKQRKYKYRVTGWADLSYGIRVELPGGLTTDAVGKCPHYFDVEVESVTDLTTEEVLAEVKPPKKGYLIADAMRDLTVVKIDGPLTKPLPDAPTKD